MQVTGTFRCIQGAIAQTAADTRLTLDFTNPGTATVQRSTGCIQLCHPVLRDRKTEFVIIAGTQRQLVVQRIRVNARTAKATQKFA